MPSCRKVQSSPFVGSACSSPCAPACVSQCAPACAPAYVPPPCSATGATGASGVAGATGATGATGVSGPSYAFTAVLNGTSPFVPLFSAPLTVPFNYTLYDTSGSFNLLTNSYVVPASGVWRFDFSLSLIAPIGAGTTNMNYTASLRTSTGVIFNLANWTPISALTASVTNAVNDYYIGYFTQGTLVSVSILSSNASVQGQVGGSSALNQPPFPSSFSGRSFF